ncbi:hypothetical protein VB773_11275 [Haloarculaceae archaeon H-GB2-1]|nr:hypothetical protein [Haloarculaceae archaeon H-GB2-1]
MYEGAFTDVVDPDDVTEEQLGLLMAGQDADGVTSVPAGDFEAEAEVGR